MYNRKMKLNPSLLDEIKPEDFYQFTKNWLLQNIDDLREKDLIVFTMSLNGDHFDFIQIVESKFVRFNFEKEQIEALTASEADWGVNLWEIFVEKYEEEWYDMLGWGEGPSAFENRYLKSTFESEWIPLNVGE